MSDARKRGLKKRIILSSHAHKRILRYRLAKEEVFGAFRSPNGVFDGYGGRKIIHKFKGNYVLRVVYEEDDQVLIVTVYPSRRVRYAKE